MQIDERILLHDNATLTASGESDVVDTLAGGFHAGGNELYLVVAADEVSTANGDETYSVHIETDASAPAGVLTPSKKQMQGTSITITEDGIQWLQLPPLESWGRFVALASIVAGTSPSINITAFITPHRPDSNIVYDRNASGNIHNDPDIR